MDTNKIVAAIFAVNADRSGWGGADGFLLHYDQMLETLEARDEAKRIAIADIVMTAAEPRK